MRLGSENDLIIADKPTPNGDLKIAIDTDLGQFETHIDGTDAARLVQLLTDVFRL